MLLYYFCDWELKPIVTKVQQYDNLSTKLVIKDVPNGWDTWYAIVARKGFLNIIELDLSPDMILSHTFTDSELAFNGEYALQIQAVQGNKRKHTLATHFVAGQTFSGDAQWVEVPSAFTDALAATINAKDAAVLASGHYPYIDESNGNWFSWDVSEEEFVDTGIHAQGPRGEDAVTFEYHQSTASSVWTITHNLNKYPSITVVDSGENIVVGDAAYIDSNSLKITFTSPFSGYAYLN